MTKLQKQFIELYRKNAINLSATCNKLNIKKEKFYNWYYNDDAFRNAIDEAREEMLDFAESMLFQNIKKGDNTAIIFFLKTIGRHRGYVEYQRLPIMPNSEINTREEKLIENDD